MTELSLILGWLSESGDKVSDLTWVCASGARQIKVC